MSQYLIKVFPSPTTNGVVLLWEGFSTHQSNPNANICAIRPNKWTVSYIAPNKKKTCMFCNRHALSCQDVTVWYLTLQLSTLGSAVRPWATVYESSIIGQHSCNKMTIS